MKYVVTLVVLIILVAGGWYLTQPKPADTASDTAQAPSQAMGLNGSANQGNLGQPDTGVVQQPQTQPIMAWTPEPGADGEIAPVVGSNLTLGLDGTGTSSHLIGYTGKTVYTYDKDSGIMSNCTGACATNWPPYVVSPIDYINQVKSGVDATKVGTTTVPAGYKDPSGFTIQLTYNGKPLYFYAGDKNGSDTLGNGKGGVWHVVMP